VYAAQHAATLLSNINVEGGYGQQQGAGGSIRTDGPIEFLVVSSDTMLWHPHTNIFTMRSGAAAPAHLRVQCLVAGAASNSMYAPPTTDKWDVVVADGSTVAGYFTPPELRENGVRLAWIGHDAAGSAVSDTGMPGFVSVACTISSTRNEHVWLRAFSAPTVTGAVFYADAREPDTLLEMPGDLHCMWDASSLVLSNLNPACRIPFLEAPHVAGPSIPVVTGRADALAGGADNRVPSEWLLAEYRLAGATQWELLASNVHADGAFDGVVFSPQYPTSAYVRVRVNDAHTPRLGLPSSAEALVTDILPEPVLVCVVLGVGVVLRRRC
jgi:hypothetical protein